MADQTNAEVSDERLRELLPCPFCGKELEFSENLSIHGGGWMHHGDEAERDKPCFLIGKIVYNTPGDLERWNRRSVTSQASEGEVVAWRYWNPAVFKWYLSETQRVQAPPEWKETPLFASPVSKRVERLETANRALAEIKESFRLAGLGTIGAHWQSLIDAIDQALQGGRS